MVIVFNEADNKTKGCSSLRRILIMMNDFRQLQNDFYAYYNWGLDQHILIRNHNLRFQSLNLDLMGQSEIWERKGGDGENRIITPELLPSCVRIRTLTPKEPLSLRPRSALIINLLESV